jgi:hypothetical protein
MAVARRQIFAVAMLMAFASCDRPIAPSTRVSSQDLQPGPIRHDALTEQQMTRLRRVQAALAEVDTQPFEKWVENFRRDAHPDREIVIYEAIADAHAKFCAARPRNIAEKRDAYGLLLQRSGTTGEDALRNYTLSALTPDDARELLSYYGEPAQPIQVHAR